MSNDQNPPHEERPRDWPIPRLVSFAAMFLTFATISLLILTAIFLKYFQPDLGNQPLLFPLLGAVLIAGSCTALLGFIAGVVDLTQSLDRRGVTVIAVLVNGGACLFVFAVTAIGFLTR